MEKIKAGKTSEKRKAGKKMKARKKKRKHVRHVRHEGTRSTLNHSVIKKNIFHFLTNSITG